MRLLAALAAATSVLGLAADAPAGPAAAPTLVVRSSSFGPMLFAGNGRALYAFTRDTRNGPSRCYGDCAAAWPVYFAGTTLRAGAGVKQSLLGTVRRKDSRRQVTYNGRPLYFYAHEKARQVLCQNVRTHGGTWLVVRPSGELVR
jgi:predicted lipoprotein with Yx(FWY)xxD motif